MRHHHYNVGQVLVVVSLVLSSATSLRGAGRALEVILDGLELPPCCPSWSSTRLWLLRLGYYKLMRAKAQGEDWVWIVDHVVQLGQEKCLLILGVRLSGVPAVGVCLSHEDVEPIALHPVKQSNGEIVYQQLEEATRKTGVPREILSDQGSDLSKGIRQFCQAHPETCAIYDIKHKVAAVLKRELEAELAWQAFTQLARQTKQRVQQTALAALAPPQQRSKSRYMNAEELVGWGSRMLQYLDDGARHQQECDQQRVAQELGWVREYRQELEQWKQLVEVVEQTEKFVKEQGLYPGSEQWLEKQLVAAGATPRTQQVREELVRFVAAESAKAKEHERLLGSSEVIESVFGKWKRLEGEQARSGLTGLVLALGAMVSRTSAEVIKKALESVPTKKVLEWCQEKLGKTVQARRREAFVTPGKSEQKQDQIKVAA